MDLTFLGTGSAVPTERAQTGLLLEEEPLLIDCGSGVLQNLVRSDVAFTDLDYVLFTHSHLDHMADFLSLVQADWLAGREELTVYGPPGLQETIHNWLEGFDYLADALRIDIIEVTPGESFDVLDRRIQTLETDHGVPTIAYRIDDQVAYSADTEPIDEMADFAEGCAVLVHECSFPDGKESQVSSHTTPTGLARILEGCDVDRVYLTHLYPEVEGNQDEMIATIEQRYSGHVTFAKDLMKVTIEE